MRTGVTTLLDPAKTAGNRDVVVIAVKPKDVAVLLESREDPPGLGAAEQFADLPEYLGHLVDATQLSEHVTQGGGQRFIVQTFESPSRCEIDVGSVVIVKNLDQRAVATGEVVAPY